MSIRRGTAYALRGGSAGTLAVLVLTNDDWNERMHDVGVVPLRGSVEDTPPLSQILSHSRPLQSVAGRLVSVEKSLLGAALLVLDEWQMVPVEDALCQVLSLHDLCRDAPRQPSSPPGRVDYPRWGEIYYAGPRVGGERKRYVVVSSDHWNHAVGSVIAVRTTTQARRWGPEFPPIQGGAARACCGDATSFRTVDFALDPRQRPTPQRLTTQDMAAIALGLVETHQLRAALDRPAGGFSRPE